MMKSPHDVALGFRDQLARTAKKVQARRPLRILVKREVPLMRETQQLGHLELLLRRSFRGEGQGTGVLVFEWPDSAKDHAIADINKALADGWLRHRIAEILPLDEIARGNEIVEKGECRGAVILTID